MWPFSLLTKFRREAVSLKVDYSTEPVLPNGAVQIRRHIPISDKAVTILSGDLELRVMPQGSTYEEYYNAHTSEGLCDVQVLDAFMKVITRTPSSIDKVIKEFFGKFSGQIFFLGTTFVSEDGRECVPFLNLHTHFPSLRYICPVTHPINHDVYCCACFFRPSKRG